jgi:hypothetical protein
VRPGDKTGLCRPFDRTAEVMDGRSEKSRILSGGGFQRAEHTDRRPCWPMMVELPEDPTVPAYKYVVKGCLTKAD